MQIVAVWLWFPHAKPALPKKLPALATHCLPLQEGPALPTMPRQDRTARIERFLSSNCSFMSLYPATFLSVALELASDVCAALQAHGVPLSQGYNPQAVVLTLSQKTQMQELLSESACLQYPHGCMTMCCSSMFSHYERMAPYCLLCWADS